MNNKWLLNCLLFALVCGWLSMPPAKAQGRTVVSANETNGHFECPFAGRFKDFANQININALGKDKLQVSFDLVYPRCDATGEVVPNTGAAAGIAVLHGDSATYSSKRSPPCKITIKFVRPGVIKVVQAGECDLFGNNVNATGTYTKKSSAKLKFNKVQ